MPEKDKILPPQTAYRKRLSDMLDLTYELEGLLHIGVTRSAVPPRLNQLIVDKLNAIVALADEPATPEELGEAGEETAYNIVEDEMADEEIADVEIAEDEMAEEDIPEEEIAEDEMVEGDIPEEEIAEDEMAEENIPEEEIAEDEKPSASSPQRGRLFSINDRFLYSREIFGGNLKNFDAAIDEIITLDSYDEAEDYLVTEWELDPESPNGMKFLSIIAKLF